MTTAIGIVHDEKVDAAWVMCLLKLRLHPDITDCIMVQGGPGNFDVARNKVAAHFLTSSAADYLLTVDTDMVFTPEDYEALRDWEVGVVSAVYFIADDPPRPCFGRRNGDGRIKTVQDWKGQGRIEVDALGGGFCLIRRDVLTDIGPVANADRGGPWYRQDLLGFAGQGLEPDHAFCQRAQEAGHHVYVDTNVVVGHIKPRVLQ